MKTFDLYFDSLDGLSLRGNGCMAEGEYVRKEDADKLQAKLEAATRALENIATHSDGIPGDEGDDAFYDYCEVKDLAAAALKSIKEDA